jgi:cephalosporin-C deacetylase-like acetyl esterase
MNSRRRFLEASSLVAGAHLSRLALRAQETAGPIPSAAAEEPVTRAYWNDLPNYLSSVINDARERRQSALARLKTPQAVRERASFVSETVWKLIGGPLEKTPLKLRHTGVIDRDAYRIEKLIFESQPQFYVPAHLYLPKSGSGPFPGILSPLGHYPESKAARSYQMVFQNLARKGYVVLTWDPPGQGERLQYLRPGTNQSLYSPTGEHDQFGWPALLVGSTTTQFETWDAVRALDYFLTRPEVDKSRIGCCGHSGGGTATMFLCALEPRIHVAVIVEGHTENVAGAHYEPPGAYADAEQNIIGGLKLGIDRGDLLAAFAPKPLLISFSHMDVGSTYSPHYEQGTREIFGELKDQYRVLGAPGKVGLFASNLPHDYDYFHRRATYRWFNQWLDNRHADDQETAFDDSPDNTLNCTTTGQVLTSLKGRAAYQVNFDRLRSLEQARRGKELTKDQLRQQLREILGLLPQASTVRAAVLSANTRPDLAIDEIQFYSEPTVRVPGWFLKPASAQGKLGVVVLLSPSGTKPVFGDQELITTISDLHIAVCAIDLRGSGQATPRFPSSGPQFYSHGTEIAYSPVSLTAGIPMIGQRVQDLLACLDYLETRSDVDASRIAVFGRGASGLEALFGTALRDRVRGVLLAHAPADYASVVASQQYNLKVASFPFGLLKHFDLPQIAAAIQPRPVWLLNPVDAKEDALTAGDISALYGSSVKYYGAADSTGEVFTAWVNATLA